MIKHVPFLSDIWKPWICLYTLWICGCTECRINDAVFLKLTWSWNLLLRSIHKISVPQYTLWTSLLMFIIPNNTLLMALEVLKPSDYYSSTLEGGAPTPSPPLQSLHSLSFTTTWVKPNMEVHTGLENESPARIPLQMYRVSFIYPSIHSFRD